MQPGGTVLLCELAMPERSVVDPLVHKYFADLHMFLLFRSVAGMRSACVGAPLGRCVRPALGRTLRLGALFTAGSGQW